MEVRTSVHLIWAAAAVLGMALLAICLTISEVNWTNNVTSRGYCQASVPGVQGAVLQKCK